MSRSKNGPAQSSRGNFTPPSRPAAASANAPGSVPLPPAGSRFAPRNWRVPTRLYAILLIPVIVGLVMGGFQVKGSIDTWREAKDAESTARLVQAALTYSQLLDEERDVSTAPLLRGHRDDPVVTKARKATDRAAAVFDRAVRQMPHTEGLERRLAVFRKAEPGLATLRADAYSSKVKGVATEEGYVAVQHPLMEFANELGLGTGNITSYGRTVYAISLTKAAVSLERSIGTQLLVKPGPKPADLGRQRTALSSYAYLEGISIEEYLSGGTPQDEAAFSRITQQLKADAKKAAGTKAAAARAKGQAYVPAPSSDAMVAALASLPSPRLADRRALAHAGVTEDSWWAANTAKFNADRKIEADLAAKAVNEAAGIADDARRATFLTGAAVLVALLAALVLAGLMARQMSRSMRRLRTAALGIAQQRLPMIVDQLSRTDPGRVDTRVQPLPIFTSDEIGEIARAFDQVHREAVRLASEQALLRGNVNAIFANLSRRNESLIDGQLTLITDLENHETDPDQLASLFRLDHLATRMRRNGENLLVLSGEEPGRSWDQPVPLVDILRAASSEVDQYARIEMVGVPEADIHGLAVTDLVHLLAELLENATVFSSPDTRVRVTATRMPDGRVVVEIHDRGIGLLPEDFADINHKLASPPAVDASLSQRMGLFVVGRLADRHGIRVQLRPSAEHAGTTSLVMLPDAITHGGGGEHQQQDAEFTVSSIIPAQQAQQAQAAMPLRTAAELGFDDSRYGDFSDLSHDLDPVSRSLRRGERQAAQVHPQPDQDAAPPSSEPAAPAGGTYASAAAQEAPYTEYGTQGVTQGTYGTHGAHGGHGGHGGHEAYAQGYFDTQHAPEEASFFGGRTQPTYDASFDPNRTTENSATGRDLRQPPGDVRPGSYTEAAEAGRFGSGQDAPGGYGFGPHQGEWVQQGSFQAAQPNPYSNEAESAAVTNGNTRDRVGFTGSGPVPGSKESGHDLTDAGLPRRSHLGSGGNAAPAASPGRHRQPDAHQDPVGWPRAEQEAPAGDPATAQPKGARRSTNDERWERAETLRAPRAGGVTPSGLPRRTPRANLVEGTAEQTSQGGPQVSRAPEDVRGRLSNLRRGVQRGLSEGTTSNGRARKDPNSGQGGPDSTYNQER